MIGVGTLLVEFANVAWLLHMSSRASTAELTNFIHKLGSDSSGATVGKCLTKHMHYIAARELSQDTCVDMLCSGWSILDCIRYISSSTRQSSHASFADAQAPANALAVLAHLRVGPAT